MIVSKIFSWIYFTVNIIEKKLKWYYNIHELSVTWDIRIIIQILIKNDKCYFLNIWSHSDLETSSKKKNKF